MNRTAERVIAEPDNRWAWYEVAKEIMASDIEQVFDYGRRHDIEFNVDSKRAIIDGYFEWELTK